MMPREKKLDTGFLHLSLMGYVVLGLVAALAASSLYGWIQTQRLESAQETIAQIKAVGEAQEAQRKKDKERSDADHQRNLARLERDNKRLRDSTSRNVLPSTAVAPGACVSGADVEREIQRFVRGAAELIIECESAVTALDSAKRWAQDGR